MALDRRASRGCPAPRVPAARRPARGRAVGEGAVPTDPLCDKAVRVFMERDAVHTIVGEVRALFKSRFPGALALLQDLAEVNGMGADAALEQHDGWDGDAARVLRAFG